MTVEKRNLTSETVFDLVRRIISSNFRIQEEEITPSASLEALDLDSIDAVDLAVCIEEEIGFHFQPDHLETIRTLQDVVDVVVSGMGSQAE